MKIWRSLILLIAIAHWAVAIGHLFLAAEVLPAPEDHVSWLAVVFISVGHLIVASVTFTLGARTAGLLALVFFVAALGADVYEHFLHPSGNNVLMVAPGAWTRWFDVSVFILLALEIMGLIASVQRFGGGRRSTRLQRATNGEARDGTARDSRPGKFFIGITTGETAVET